MLSGWTQEEVAAARAAILEHEKTRRGLSDAAGKYGIKTEVVGEYGNGCIAFGMGLRTHDPAATKAKALITWAYGDVVPI